MLKTSEWEYEMLEMLEIGNGIHLKSGERFRLDNGLLELLNEGGRAEILLAWLRPDS